MLKNAIPQVIKQLDDRQSLLRRSVAINQKI